MKQQVKQDSQTEEPIKTEADALSLDPNQKVDDQAPDSPPMDPFPKGEESEQLKVITAVLNVRKKSTKESEILFKVQKDDILTKIETEDTPEDWIKMIFNGKLGWVMKEFTEKI